MPDRDHIVFCSEENFSEVLLSHTEEPRKFLVLADTNTAKYCYPILRDALPSIDDDSLIIIDAGDEEKNITNLHYIWSSMQFRGADRNSCLINLGGGMVSDLGGFAASTYLRGIDHINIPTSLLGMVDASIGGKTSINISRVKNQAGTFARAKAIIVNPVFLDTLPEEEFLSGYAEVLKTAIVFDRELYYDLLETKLEDLLMVDVIRKAATIKQEVTAKDFHDRSERQCLNFGHTIGHGLEAFFLSKGQELKHGFAVAAGMVCATYISAKVLNFPEQGLQQITNYIRRSFPPLKLRETDIDDIIALIRHDKKKFQGEIRMSLLNSIENCTFGIAVPEEIIRESVLYYLQYDVIN
ncbi:MAG: 3-dehydroquinate synthase family protein [Bacteroidales bacterium]|jgi:3-dehydroquinate synthase|nr:3-dehydroquinate synthase family protein [Bacteroidales bacterium]